LYHLSSWWGTL